MVDYYVNSYHGGSEPSAQWTAGVGTATERQNPSAPDAQSSQYAQERLDVLQATPYRRMHDLPVFSGRPEKWPSFTCSFHDTTRLFGYTGVENLLRLQKALTGDAKRRVESILIRPEHVDKTLEALAKAFGRPETLVESQISEARKLPRIAENQLDQIVPFSISVAGLVCRCRRD